MLYSEERKYQQEKKQQKNNFFLQNLKFHVFTIIKTVNNYREKHSIRLLFLYYEKEIFSLIHYFYFCSQEIVDWYLSIRGARLKFLTPYLYDVDPPMVSLYPLYPFSIAFYKSWGSWWICSLIPDKKISDLIIQHTKFSSSAIFSLQQLMLDE